MIETFFILFIIFGLLWHFNKRPKNFPPGPVCLPIVGNLLTVQKDIANPQVAWDYLRERYGPFTGIIVPNYMCVVVSGWNAILEVLLNEDLQGRPDACLLRDRFNGGRYGLIFNDGEDWRVQRRFTLHHFRNLGFGRKTHESIIHEEIQSLKDEIEGLQGAPVVMEDLLGISAINITWHLIGGQRYNRKDPILLKLVGDVRESLHNVQVVGSFAVVFPLLRYIFPEWSGYRGVKSGSEGILEFIRNSVKEHKERFSEDIEASEHSSFVQIYLKKMFSEAMEENSTFSMGQLEGICMDLLSAGSDTTSGVLSFALLFVCLYPDLQEKIYKEICNVVGSERLPSYDDKPSLVYTEAFLTEVLRYRYPVPTYPPHRALKDTKVKGFNIPRGTVLIPNVKPVFTDPDYWGDPENFRPERFITNEGKFRKDERMIVFGKGKRSCMGETLAKMSSFLIFSSLVQKFIFQLPEGEIVKDTEGTPGFTTAPPHFRVTAIPRRCNTLISSS